MEWIVPLMWFIGAVLLILIEASTFNLVSVWFALGAIAAMFTSVIFPKMYHVQVFVFLGVSIFMIFTIRNYAVKKFRVQSIKTNVNSLIGKRVVVSQKIAEFEFGEVKVDGNFWTAKSLDGSTLDVGDVVEITEVSGVKLIVRKFDEVI